MSDAFQKGEAAARAVIFSNRPKKADVVALAARLEEGDERRGAQSAFHKQGPRLWGFWCDALLKARRDDVKTKGDRTVRLPSEKALRDRLRLTPEKAALVRGLINGAFDPESVEATADWLRQCYGRPSKAEQIANALDAVCETHGVEALGAEIDPSFTPQYSYLNAGDTYAATLILDNETGRWQIGCWGDLVESGKLRDAEF